MSQCIGKRRFSSEEEAETALKLIRSSPAAWERDKVPCKHYHCDICLNWHLTAMPQKAGPKRKKKGVIRG